MINYIIHFSFSGYDSSISKVYTTTSDTCDFYIDLGGTTDENKLGQIYTLFYPSYLGLATAIVIAIVVSTIVCCIVIILIVTVPICICCCVGVGIGAASAPSRQPLVVNAQDHLYSTKY